MIALAWRKEGSPILSQIPDSTLSFKECIMKSSAKLAVGRVAGEAIMSRAYAPLARMSLTFCQRRAERKVLAA